MRVGRDVSDVCVIKRVVRRTDHGSRQSMELGQMLDLARLTGMVGGFLGQDAGRPRIDVLADKLGELGFDPSMLDNGEYQEILTQLQEQGIDITNLTTSDLGSLIDQNALDGVLPEFLERSNDNAA